MPFGGGVRFMLKRMEGNHARRIGLDRVVDALRLAAAGLDQLFECKGIKSHMLPNPDGHPWIRVMHPMDEVRFIGITPNRGEGPIYLKLRVFLYEQ